MPGAQGTALCTVCLACIPSNTTYGNAARNRACVQELVFANELQIPTGVCAKERVGPEFGCFNLNSAPETLKNHQQTIPTKNRPTCRPSNTCPTKRTSDIYFVLRPVVAIHQESHPKKNPEGQPVDQRIYPKKGRGRPQEVQDPPSPCLVKQIGEGWTK